MFISFYTDHNSFTYGNGTRSYSLANDNTNLGTCAVEASKLLKLPHIYYAIQQIEAKKDYGLSSRNSRLNEIAKGYHRKETTTKEVITDKNGEQTIKEKTVVTSPNASQSINAIRELNKVSNVYGMNNVTNKAMSKALTGVFKSIITLDRQESKEIRQAEAQETEQEPKEYTEIDKHDSELSSIPLDSPAASTESLGGKSEAGGGLRLPPVKCAPNFQKIKTHLEGGGSGNGGIGSLKDASWYVENGLDDIFGEGDCG